MRPLAYFFLLALSFVPLMARADYVPLGAIRSFSGVNYLRHEPVKSEARPNLPGMRPIELELLEDALARKMPRKIGTSKAKAHESIIRNSLRDPVKRSHMRGILAEALYLERNPAWGYVKSPTASQCDVYTWGVGRKFICSQIKTHASGNPLTYAKDMIDDHKARHFVVPDDHVDALKQHWRNEVKKYELAGQRIEAANAQRQLYRIRGLGYTAQGLDDKLSTAAKYALRERQASYVSLGAGLAMAIGPELENWIRTGSLNSLTSQRAVHASAILASERATTYALSKFAGGAWRGGLRGNSITGAVILFTEAGLTIYEQGGSQAFQNVGFFTQLGGGIGALALGMASGTFVTSTISPYNPAIGAAAGFIVGSAVGLAGYLFGQRATLIIIETLHPDFFHKAENTAITDAKENISKQIQEKISVGIKNLKSFAG